MYAAAEGRSELAPLNIDFPRFPYLELPDNQSTVARLKPQTSPAREQPSSARAASARKKAHVWPVGPGLNISFYLLADLGHHLAAGCGERTRVFPAASDKTSRAEPSWTRVSAARTFPSRAISSELFALTRVVHGHIVRCRRGWLQPPSARQQHKSQGQTASRALCSRLRPPLHGSVTSFRFSPLIVQPPCGTTEALRTPAGFDFSVTSAHVNASFAPLAHPA